MKTITTLATVLSSLSSFVLAISNTTESFTPSVRNQIQGLNGAEIQANNGIFYVGKPSAGVCCPSQPDCAAKLMTWVYAPAPSTTTAFLATVGSTQQLFLSKTGTLEYTVHGNESVFPPGAWVDGFMRVEWDNWTEGYNTDKSPYLQWEGQDWFVCEDGSAEGVYRIHAQVFVDASDDRCHPFHLRLDRHRMGSEGAVEYYN